MTYAYLHLPSAELLQDGRVTRATDIYSFAMIMMELYTGRQLFEGLRSQQVAGPASFFGLVSRTIMRLHVVHGFEARPHYMAATLLGRLALDINGYPLM